MKAALSDAPEAELCIEGSKAVNASTRAWPSIGRTHADKEPMRVLPKIISIGLLAGLWLISAPALACKCMLLTPTEAYAQADGVLEARVVEVRELAADAEHPGARRSVKVRVVRAWKGVEAEQLELITNADSAACGFDFKVDQSYFVYASTQDGALWVNACSRTRAMADANDDLKVLGMGATTVDPRADLASADGGTPKKEPPARGGCASCSIRSARLPENGSGLLFGCSTLLLYRTRRATSRRRSASRS